MEGQICLNPSEGQTCLDRHIIRTSCIQPSLSDAHHPEEATEVLKGTILGFVSWSKMLESRGFSWKERQTCAKMVVMW